MFKRISSFVLALVMIQSAVPVHATSHSNDVKAATISCDGNTVNTVELESSGSVRLSVDDVSGFEDYQWQILVSDDLWVDIYNATDTGLNVNYALVANAMQGDVATLRCKLEEDQGVVYSNSVAVKVVPDAIEDVAAEAEKPDYKSEAPKIEEGLNELDKELEDGAGQTYGLDYYEPEATPPESDEESDEESSELDEEPGESDEELDAEFSELDEESDELEEGLDVGAVQAYGLERSADPVTPADVVVTYSTVEIKYVYPNGITAAPSWKAEVVTGSDLYDIVKSPDVIGYSPDIAEVVVNYDSVDEDDVIVVTYNPAEVEFKVIHYVQDITDDSYYPMSTTTHYGYTGDTVGEGLEEKMDGFYSLAYKTSIVIAADGNTEVEIYYDRFYYLVSFDLSGGYGTDPIYARYESSIDVKKPKRAGYEFAGWDKSLPDTMPIGGGHFKALWSEGEAPLTVVFWYENANDTKYTDVGSIDVTGVSPGDVVSSSQYKDYSFDGRDNDHFTYNAAMAEDVTIQGGANILNVYFTRNTYDIVFTGSKLTCTQTEHSHTSTGNYRKGMTRYYVGGCYPEGSVSGKTGGATSGNEICGIAAHTHSTSKCYTNGTIYTDNLKYDSNITHIWTNGDIKSLIDSGFVFKSSVTGSYYSFLEKMPGYNLTLTSTQWSGNEYKWYYYLEIIPGNPPEGKTLREDKGVTYYEYDSTTVKGNSINLTYEEDYYPITGFKQRDTTVPSFSNRVAYLYYTREDYTLSFYNHDSKIDDKGGNYYFEQDISDAYFKPSYPATLEPGAYVFEGWYTSPFFGDTKFDFNGATMPAQDTTLYARWVPTQHKVNVYLTSDMSEENRLMDEQVLYHGETAVEPEQPTNGSYTFVGWFFMDGNIERAFDFSMAVTTDMELYAKWSSNVVTKYNVYYRLADGTDIAEPLHGAALAGSTKTFDAKVGEQLYGDYRQGFFPDTSSTSMAFNVEDAIEEYDIVFTYTELGSVEYTVRYLDKTTGQPLSYIDSSGTVKTMEDKVSVTSNNIVTESFVPIEGFLPDAYQKRLGVSSNSASNILEFYYTADSTHGIVLITHYTENVDDEGYTEYKHVTDPNGLLGDEYQAYYLDILGFTKNEKAPGTLISSTLTIAGLHLKLYYDRNEYPYEFRFVDKETQAEIAPRVEGVSKYQNTVHYDAVPIEGYKLVSNTRQKIDIRIEYDVEPSRNIAYFEYTTKEDVTVNYAMVGPDGAGQLSRESELITEGATALGSKATVNPGFKFIGWYFDADCKNAVPKAQVSSDGTFLPVKNNKGEYDATTYYAKFEYGITDLIISKSGVSTIDKDQSFVYIIKGLPSDDNTSDVEIVVTVAIPEGKTQGRTVVKALPSGKYTITEVEDWSWRYKKQSTQAMALESATYTVSFDSQRTIKNWLDGQSFNVISPE